MLKKSLTAHFSSSILTVGLLLLGFGIEAQEKTAQVLPENVPGLLVKANKAYAAKDYPGFRDAMVKINEKRPYNSEYMFQLVIAHALLDEKRPAYDMMVHMQQQGLAYDFSKVDNAKNIKGTEVFSFINDMMIMSADPVGESETVFTLPKDLLMPEAITWDETRQKFLVGSVVDGSIVAVGEDGQVTELLKANKENGMWAVLDILVDVPRKTLWVTSAATPRFSGFEPADKNRSALFEYNLETLELVHSYPVPVDGRPHSLGTMALSPKGDLFIADRVLPILFIKPAGEQKLKAMVASREMVSQRGIAMQPDGRIMYVADRELGVLIIDVEAGRSGKLGVPDTLNLGGIDGLYLWDNHLVIIQNGIKPQRVMRLQLDATGTKVVAVRPLAVALPDFDFPSYGVVVGDDLVYFASNQWITAKKDIKPVMVLRTALNASGDLQQPDMVKYLQVRGDKLTGKKE